MGSLRAASMNRVLYLIIGGFVAGVMALALFEKQNSGTVSSTDFRAVIGFCLTMAAAACFLIYSRLGRHGGSGLIRRPWMRTIGCTATLAPKARYDRPLVRNR